MCVRFDEAGNLAAGRARGMEISKMKMSWSQSRQHLSMALPDTAHLELVWRRPDCPAQRFKDRIDMPMKGTDEAHIS